MSKVTNIKEFVAKLKPDFEYTADEKRLLQALITEYFVRLLKRGTEASDEQVVAKGAEGVRIEMPADTAIRSD